MSLPTTATITPPPLENGTICGQRLVLNVEMSFIREQLLSQSTHKSSTRCSQRATANELFLNGRRTKGTATLEKRRRLHPLDVYFKSEEARRRHKKNMKYQYNNYVAESETVEPLNDNDVGMKNERSESRLFLPEIEDTRDTRKVDFVSQNKTDNEKLPSLAPVSRGASTMANYCDVTILCKTPPTPHILPNGRERKTKQHKTNADDNADLYNITFRSTRGSRNYDPESELHSDYYTIRKVESQNNVNMKYSQTLRDSLKYSRSKRFNAVLVGTQKYLHKKHDIEDDGHRSVPVDQWNHNKLAYDAPGYSSVPLRTARKQKL